MPAAITADQLLDRIRLRAMMATTDGRVTSAEILTLADDAILSNVGREVYDADDGRWVKTAADVAITAGRTTYRIPDRALASGLDEVLIVDSTGAASPLDVVDRSLMWQWGASTGVPSAYAIVGDVLHLLPTPASAGYSLRVLYVRRPSRLALVSACVTLTGAASGTLSGTIPSAWSSPTTIDVVQSANNVEALEDDVSITFASTTLTRTSSGSFATSGAYAIAAGDYACLAGTSCVVQVPDVAVPYVADLVARDLCSVLDDAAGAARCAAQAEERRKDMLQAIARRTRQQHAIVPSNSPLRLGGVRTQRWRR